ncbi:MAG: carboxypeptidase-like regulatory domain-containing protein, partial [Bacteroidota bacterium]
MLLGVGKLPLLRAEELSLHEEFNYLDSEHNYQEEKVIPLVELLEKIQKEFGVSFNYDDQLIRKKKIKINKSDELSKNTWIELLDIYMQPLGIKAVKLSESIYVLKSFITVSGDEPKQQASAFEVNKAGVSLGSLNTQDSVIVEGIITDSGGEGLPGATVQVKGTLTGTITDVNGGFKLEIPSTESTLAVNYVGFIPQELSVGDKRIFKIILKEDVTTLDEVVVVGYGTQRKKDLSSSIAIVDVDQLKTNLQLSVNESLQGLTPGVTVTGSGGAPGRNPKINIRGIASVNNVQPLYVVDGVP